MSFCVTSKDERANLPLEKLRKSVAGLNAVHTLSESSCACTCSSAISVPYMSVCLSLSFSLSCDHRCTLQRQTTMYVPLFSVGFSLMVAAASGQGEDEISYGIS